MAGPLLQVNGVSKRFGGLVAINDVSFEIHPGEIVGLLGPNGAGKTTLFNMLSGFTSLDAGTVSFDGQPCRRMAPSALANLGLARTFQLCRPLLGMTVLENVMVGCLAPRIRKVEPPVERARRILGQVGLGQLANVLADVLPYGDLRRLEIGRALATNPKLLLLDEPFAGLGSSEIEPLSTLIRELHRQQQVSVFIVEHHLREFMQLVERVIVLDFGKVIAEGTPDEVVRNESVIDAYIGREDIEGEVAADVIA